jgi:hypothetical protein
MSGDSHQSGGPDPRDQVRSIIAQASPEARQLITAVLQIEQAKIHLGRPTGVAREIVDEVHRLVS